MIYAPSRRASANPSLALQKHRHFNRLLIRSAFPSFCYPYSFFECRGKKKLLLTREHRAHDNKRKPDSAFDELSSTIALQKNIFLRCRIRVCHFFNWRWTSAGATLFYNRVETRTRERGRDGKVCRWKFSATFADSVVVMPRCFLSRESRFSRFLTKLSPSPETRHYRPLNNITRRNIASRWREDCGSATLHIAADSLI